MLIVEFGFYPSILEFNTGSVAVQPLDGHREIIENLLASPNIEKDWFYAPASKSGAEHKAPYSARVFDLPKTHLLTHESATDKDHLTFIIWCLSFFNGQRLTATEAGFLDCTPTKPGKLVDFILAQDTLVKGINFAEIFWSANSEDKSQPKRLAAAIHALFMAQNPQLLQFERFLYLYMALDVCYKLISTADPTSGHATHSRRTKWMCQKMGLNVPSWADCSDSGNVEIADMRNNTIHEALYMEEPLGFALHGVGSNQNLPLQMEALVCRLLIAIIAGASSDYALSPVNTGQIHMLKL